MVTGRGRGDGDGERGRWNGEEEGCGRKGWCWMVLDGVASLISLVGAKNARLTPRERVDPPGWEGDPLVVVEGNGRDFSWG